MAKQTEEVALKLEVEVSASSQTSVKSLRDEVKTYTSEALKAKAAGNNMLAADFIKKAAVAKEALKDVNEEIRALDTGDRAKAFANLGTTIAGAFSAATGAAALFGEENENVQRALLKVQAATAVLQGVQALADAKRNLELVRYITNLGKLSPLLILTGIQTKAVAAAQALWAFATQGTSLAFKALRVAIVATGIGALVVLIGQLIANFDRIKDAVLEFVGIAPGIKKTQEQIDALNEANKRLNDSFLDESTKRKEAIKDEAAEFIKAGVALSDVYKFVFNEQKKLREQEEKERKEQQKKREDEAKAEAKRIEDERLKRVQSELQFIRDQFARDQQTAANRKTVTDKAVEDQKAADQKIKDGVEERTNASIAANTKDAEVFAETSAAKQDLAIALQEAERSIANQYIGLLGEVADAAGRETAFGKGLATAQALIDTYASANAAYRSQLSVPSPDAPFRAALAAGAAVAAGLLQVRRILAVKVPGGGGNNSPSLGPPTTAVALPQAPNLASTNTTNISQPTNTPQQPIRAYIVETDLRDSTERATNRDRRSTF